MKAEAGRGDFMGVLIITGTKNWYNVLMAGRQAKMQKKKLIRFRQSLFWDVDPKNIDPKKNARYVIERIMDFGYDSEVRWMWEYYPHKLLRDVAEHSRVIHDKTRPLWLSLIPKKS